jgi:hypothetical protein
MTISLESHDNTWQPQPQPHPHEHDDYDQMLISFAFTSPMGHPCQLSLPVRRVSNPPTPQKKRKEQNKLREAKPAIKKQTQCMRA